MLLRTKSGQWDYRNADLLLSYLGVKKETPGIQKLSEEVELIASVPLVMSSEQGEKSKGRGMLWTLSTFDLDRTGERIDPEGWEVKQYMKNPVVEWSHRWDIPAIGKIDGLTIDDTGLHGVVVFNDKEYDPFAWSIEQRVKAGVLRAGSVGFRVMEIEIPDRETAKDGTALIFRKQELLEFSICNVPANPWALAMSSEKGEKSKEIGRVVNSFWGGVIPLNI
ncbi:MAG: HK97 family phage prohead protease [Spirochaetaceae bacterium]|jgi:HK97 family phage prohead protease|nr:HK97 family phage prohead protease [Spirochaetaceae bacterium]